MVSVDLIGEAVAHAAKARDLRKESEKFADAAAFHDAVSRAFLRDLKAGAANDSMKGRERPVGGTGRSGARPLGGETSTR